MDRKIAGCLIGKVGSKTPSRQASPASLAKNEEVIGVKNPWNNKKGDQPRN